MEALMQAVGKGEEGTIMRLLDEDPGLLERVDQDGHRPLIKAAMDGQLGVVKLLLQREADADATGRFGGTALYWAAKGGREEMATFLLSNGADANIIDVYGRVPLIAACWKGHLGVVRVLLHHTGTQELEETDDYGRTALHWAARGGHEDVVAYLLSKDAHADSRNDVDRTPLMSACWKGRVGVVRLLLQHTGAEGLEETDEYGMTALHVAAKYGQTEVTTFLLGQGADVKATTEKCRTPLMLACWKCHLGVVRVLLQHVGEEGLQATDWSGKTALHLAAKFCYGGIVRLLLCAGADPTVEDDDRRTPRALAGYWGNAECVAVFKWWEDELERRYILSRATFLHKANATRRDKPTPGLPTFLEARLPSVEVGSLQAQGGDKEDQAGTSGKRKAAGEGGSPPGADVGEEERHAVLSYVLKDLNEELLTELLEGFHS